MVEISIVLSPDRPLDPTGPLDYVALTLLVAYYALAALALLFVAVNALYKRSDVTVLGWPGLIMMLVGSCLDLTGEFITNGHLSQLDSVRMIDCHVWDYWIKFLSQGLFFSGLCLCMVNASAFIFPRLQQVMARLERPKNRAVKLGLVVAPSIHAVSDAAAADDDNDSSTMEAIELTPDNGVDLEQRENSEKTEEQQQQRRKKTGGPAAANEKHRPRRLCCASCFKWLFRPCTLPIEVFWSKLGPIQRLWALCWAAVVAILGVCVAMVVFSYIPGVTEPVADANTCYTKLYYKALFVAALAVFLAAGWYIYLAATYSDVREYFRIHARRLWRYSIEPPLLKATEVLLLFLARGIMLLDNPASRWLLFRVAPLYLTSGAARFDTNPARFASTTGHYLKECARNLLFCLFGGCIWCVVRNRARREELYRAIHLKPPAAASVYDADRAFLYDVKELPNGEFFEEQWNWYHLIKAGPRAGASALAALHSKQEVDADLRYCRVDGKTRLTGANFSLALTSVTASMLARVAFNVLCLVSFIWGRFLYFLIAAAAYTVALGAVLGDAYLCRLRGCSRAADAISKLDQQVPRNFSNAVYEHNHRVVLEFLEFARSTAVNFEQEAGAGDQLVSFFNWRGLRDAHNFAELFQDEPSRFIECLLVPRKQSRLYTNISHVAVRADARDQNRVLDDVSVVYVPHVVAFLDAYLECASRFESVAFTQLLCLREGTEVDRQLALLEQLSQGRRTTDRCDEDELRRACSKLFNTLFPPSNEAGAAPSESEIREESAVPLRGNRTVIVRSAKREGRFVPALVEEEMHLAVAILDELLWTEYYHSPSSMAWLRVAKAHADMARRREAARALKNVRKQAGGNLDPFVEQVFAEEIDMEMQFEDII